MKYKIIINGMHCNGCKNLIKLSLEENGFKGASVNLEENSASFFSDKSIDEIRCLLDIAFADLAEYKYSNLEVI